MRLLFLPFICAGLSHPCFADAEGRADDIVAAWSTWVRAGGTTTSTIAVMRNGVLVANQSVGVTPNTPLPIASLSKALTAECLRRISDADAVALDTPLGDVLRVPADMQAITMAQLLTHTSGIWPDGTQNNAALRDLKNAPTPSIAQRAIDRDTQGGVTGTYAYNNENYAILGAVIEAVTDMPYDQACTEALFDPLDIDTATLDGEWAPHRAWGGWSISAADYARFAWDTFTPGAGDANRPDDLPSTALDGGARYGMGVLWREINGRYLVWSSGMLCWDGNGDGGYFASYGGEWLVVTLYADCLAGTERLRDLDEALFRAAIR